MIMGFLLSPPDTAPNTTRDAPRVPHDRAVASSQHFPDPRQIV